MGREWYKLSDNCPTITAASQSPSSVMRRLFTMTSTSREFRSTLNRRIAPPKMPQLVSPTRLFKSSSCQWIIPLIVQVHHDSTFTCMYMNVSNKAIVYISALSSCYLRSTKTRLSGSKRKIASERPRRRKRETTKKGGWCLETSLFQHQRHIQK